MGTVSVAGEVALNILCSNAIYPLTLTLSPWGEGFIKARAKK